MIITTIEHTGSMTLPY